MMPFLAGFTQDPTPHWLLAVPAASIIFDGCAVSAVRHWMKEPAPESNGPLAPVTFFRPLKRGVPNLKEKLAALLAASQPEDQFLFGVDAGAEEETICEDLRRAHPDRIVEIVRCAPAQFANPKIAKLMQMEPLATHAAWLLADSEMIFDRAFLDGFRREWQARETGALTAGYRFMHAQSLPQRCDALGILLTLWPGLALVRRFGQVTFTLGACTLFRREALQAAGGWSAFAQELGEDQRSGAALVKAGYAVHLSRHVATLASDEMSWREYWWHQRRVAVTYRAGNPAGFAGMIVTFGPVWSFLCLALSHSPQFALMFVVSLALRVWRIWKTSRALDFRVRGLLAGSAIASIVEAVCWALSWFPSRVWWSGGWWRVDFRGQLSRPE